MAVFLAGPASPLLGHGGNYVPPPPYEGPGDLVPTGGAAAPGVGGSAGATPGGARRSPVPNGPGTPGPATPQPAGSPSGPTTPDDSLSLDWTSWELWWQYNRHPYLRLQEHLEEGGVVTGSDDFFLGRGESGVTRDLLRPSDELVLEKIQPFLEGVVRTEGSKDMLGAALVALGKTARTEPVTTPADHSSRTARPLLLHGNREVADSAAIALAIADGPESVDLLLRLVASDVAHLRTLHWLSFRTEVPERTRAFAAYGSD